MSNPDHFSPTDLDQILLEQELAARPEVGGFAIDSDGVKDPEQVFVMEWLNGNKETCRIWLSFSDGPLFVPKNSPDDLKAKSMGVTHYFDELDEEGKDRELMLSHASGFTAEITLELGDQRLQFSSEAATPQVLFAKLNLWLLSKLRPIQV